MNRNIYRLVKNQWQQWVPVAEVARGTGKGRGVLSGRRLARALGRRMLAPRAQAAVDMPGRWSAYVSGGLFAAGLIAMPSVYAEDGLPTPCGTCGGAAAFVQYGLAGYNIAGSTGTVSQVGDKAILNWRDFNVANGKNLVFQQVTDLLNLTPVAGASFSTLNQIWDADPSVIAGKISTAHGQTANLMFINQNGIVFANGADININSLTASSLALGSDFFLNSLVPVGNSTPQFQNGLDGNPNTGGFVQVLEGAKITSGTGGRVLLIAPTVTNAGKISTPEGQTILAAGSKVYLTAAAADSGLRGLLVEVDNSSLPDKAYETVNSMVPATVANPAGGAATPITLEANYNFQGNATNLGEITAVRGNVTMVGMGVNQMGRTTATTSVTANGSVYLLAKTDVNSGFKDTEGNLLVQRAGRLVLGEGSLTQVLPETTDKTKTKEAVTPSRIVMLGNQVMVEEKATVQAPAGKVEFYATSGKPSDLGLSVTTGKSNTTSPFAESDAASTRTDASVRIARGALIDVSGVSSSASVAENFTTIKLLGAELADSPLNRTGLRGTEVSVDLVKGSSLIANIADYQKNREQTIAQISSSAGTVSLNSQGDVVLQQGTTVNLSGGQINYTADRLTESTLLGADGKTYSIADAPATLKYSGLTGSYTVSSSQWGTTETFSRANTSYNPGYVQGGDAGTLVVNGRQNYIDSAVLGKVTPGENQLRSGDMPLAAQLQIGSALAISGETRYMDRQLNQNILVGNNPSALGGTLTLDTPLSTDQTDNLRLRSSLFGADKIGRLVLNSNKTIQISSDIDLGALGSLTASAHDLAINADIRAAGGTLALNGVWTARDASTLPTISLANGVGLDVAGRWVNDTSGTGLIPPVIHAGSISLKADVDSGTQHIGQISFGDAVVLDVRGGAYRSHAGQITAGTAGDVTLAAAEITSSEPLQTHMRAESLDEAGTLTLTTRAVQVGGSSPASGTLHLNSGFFQQGFSDYVVNAYTGLTVAANSKIEARPSNLLIKSNVAIVGTGADMSQVANTVVLPERDRAASNVTLKASSEALTTASLNVETGASFTLDAGGNLSLSATRSLDIDGTLSAAAGKISLSLDNSSVPGNTDSADTQRIHLGEHASLLARGASRVFANSRGLRTGDVLSGGTVSLNALTGYVDTEAGALIDISGAAPVALDIVSTSGFGQSVASDAGKLIISANTGLYLDHTNRAFAGDALHAGGTVSLQAGIETTSANTLHVGNVGSRSPASLQEAGAVRQAYVDAQKLESAGFDRISLQSNSTLQLEGDQSLGDTRSLQSIALLAPNIVSDGGNVSLQAAIVKLGNNSTIVPAAISTGSGLLAVDARLIELVGESSYSGFADLDFSSLGELRLGTGDLPGLVSAIGALERPQALTTSADVTLTAAAVSPSSGANFVLDATGHDVTFNTTPGSKATTPLSALGDLTVKAANITQNGRILAPFGRIDLQATGDLVLGAGSLTSVAGDPARLMPMGRTLNGTTWHFATSGNPLSSQILNGLPEKTIALKGNNISTQAGAVVSVAGGGDLQAWEFAPGVGGSSDLLAQDGYYAILPGYSGLAAPYAPDVSNSDLAVGQSVYLAGGNGLKAGQYTLLPARYALLPGAYAIRLDNGVSDVIPGRSYTSSDGITVMPGFLSDSTTTAAQISGARWTGYELLSHDQVRQRSEYTLTLASQFFAAKNDVNQTVNAGLLSLNVVDNVNLAASFVTNGITSGKLTGRNAAVDISASKIAVVDGDTAKAGVATDEVALDITQLNALKADSLLLGATRSRASDGTLTTLNVGATALRVDAQTGSGETLNALRGRELMLAAKDRVSLQHQASLVADGASGDAGTYSIAGNGAFVRAAANTASVVHTGTVDRSQGDILGDSTASITASKSIILDATRNNQYLGSLAFAKNGVSQSEGSLILGSSNISLGDAPDGTSGLVFDPAALDVLGSLSELTLRSYAGFDLYGTATLGKLGSGGLPIMQQISLQGAGLRGMGTSGDQFILQAAQVSLSNPDGASFSGSTTGSGTLGIKADQLTLGTGSKQLTGFSTVNLDVTELYGQGKGSLQTDAQLNLEAARISGESGSSQSLVTTGALQVSRPTVVGTLPETKSIAADWALQGASLDFDSHMQIHGGFASLTATAGNLHLGSHAMLDVSGLQVVFFDQTRAADAGKISLIANTGNISADADATLNVSKVSGGKGGSLEVSAVAGTADIASASLLGNTLAAGADDSASGSQFKVDALQIANLDALNDGLNTGRFEQSRSFRLRSGDFSFSGSGEQAMRAEQITIEADAGSISIAGELDADAADKGRIGLYAQNGITLTADAHLHANSLASESGGQITLATRAGALDLQTGSVVNVRDTTGAAHGEILLRTPRTGSGAGTGVAVTALAGELLGATSTVLEAVQTYTGITTLNSGSTLSGSTLGLGKITADVSSFMTNKDSILAALAKTGDTSFHLRAGAEVQSTGTLTVGATATDLNLYSTTRAGGEPGTLSLLAQGNLTFNGSLSDGVVVGTASTRDSVGTGDSWSYRLVAGADASAANPMQVNANGTGDFTLAENKRIRTGTGDIAIAAGGNFDLGKKSGSVNQQTGVIYTLGVEAPTLDAFTVAGKDINLTGGTSTLAPQANNFTYNGGDISIDVKGDIRGSVTSQLYSNWLFRQGKTNAEGNFDSSNPQTAWWVRFDQFQQGVATLGGGDITVRAGGDINNLGVSAATNGRMNASTQSADKLVVLGGGDVSVAAGGDIQGGLYYTGKGDLAVHADGDFTAETRKTRESTPKDFNVYPVIAMADTQAAITARGDVHLQAVINPTLVAQTVVNTSGATTSTLRANNVRSSSSETKLSYFSTYADSAALSMNSQAGDTILENDIGGDSVAVSTKGLIGAYNSGLTSTATVSGLKYSGYRGDLLRITPANLSLSALVGEIAIEQSMNMMPSADGNLALMAQSGIALFQGVNNGTLLMSDADPASISRADRVSVSSSTTGSVTSVMTVDPNKYHGTSLLHAADTIPVRLYAVNGDIATGDDTAGKLYLPKNFDIRAGRDIANIGVVAQNLRVGDVSRLSAGRDLIYTSDISSNVATKSVGAEIRLGGPGRLEIEAGRDVDLGAMNGISTTGNTENIALPAAGASIHIAAGVPQGVDYAGTIDRLIDAVTAARTAGIALSDSTLWQVRWLTGNNSLTDTAKMLTALADYQILSTDSDSVRAAKTALQYEGVRNMFYLALRETGRDYNDPDSPYAAEYTRGYDTIALLFPAKDASGKPLEYNGDIRMTLSSIKTISGGDIEFMVPGGDLQVGLVSQTPLPSGRTTTDLGMVALGNESAIRGFTDGDMLVNQSRILTAAGGDVLLWSSNGDIDAGKGKRTASAVPPPTISIDSKGNVVVQQPAATAGSGIGALGLIAGDVDLIAPNGTVNAGDAGIRANNINIAAQTVLNAGNITATGTSTGTPVADTGALGGALAGASGVGSDVAKNIAQELAKNSAPPLSQQAEKPLAPIVVRTRLISLGKE